MDSVFEGAFTRFDGQLSRLEELVNLAGDHAPKLSQAAAERAVRALIEAVVVMQVAYLEDMLKSILGLAAFLNQDAGRRLIGGSGLKLIPAARSHVRFRKNAVRLEHAFRVLFNCDVWPSVDAKRLVLDLVRVRNVYVHEGGDLSDESAAEMQTPSLIVERVGLKRLDVAPHMAAMLMAVSALAHHIAAVAARHPIYRR